MAFDLRMEQVASLFSEGALFDEPTPVERRKRRDVLFQESLPRRLSRVMAGVSAAVHATHLAEIPSTLDFLLRESSIGQTDLPEPSQALSKPDGLCGLAKDLQPLTMVEAYCKGLYVMAPVGPATWWSPGLRYVLHPANIRVSGKVRGHLHRRALQFTLDRNFDDVVAACAGLRNGAAGAGFGPRLMRAYGALHDAGFAHSFELRDETGRLVSGGIGLALGRHFVTECTFGRADHIDVGMVLLCRHLARWGFVQVDAKADASLERLGFAPMERAAFTARLLSILSGGRPGRWKAEPDICERDYAPPASPDRAARPRVPFQEPSQSIAAT